jgi:hypothetical protein
MKLEDLIKRYPRLYHMAEADSWPSIQQHGLLSTAAAARRSTMGREAQRRLIEGHRDEKVPITLLGIGQILLRDQKPMSPERLTQAFLGGMTVGEWFALINARVFFWAEEHRLMRLLNAQHYRALEHDVLTIDTASLLEVHSERVRLCHMNSGNTYPIPHYRGRDTFRTIADYEVTRTGRPRKEVVEVTVMGEVGDIADHVLEVRRMRGRKVLRKLPLAQRARHK